MSRASLTFISSWYWRTWRVMSCLALWSASSRSLMRSLASLTASSPRSSASAIWASKLFRLSRGEEVVWTVIQTSYSPDKTSKNVHEYHKKETKCIALTCDLTISISDCSLIILRFMSAISALVDFRSLPYWPADCCISAYWYRQRQVRLTHQNSPGNV